jgi:sporadic carbohydrate cluster protein (TIGR04323 family)
LGLKIVGYITTDSLNAGFIPHQIQNITIKQFTEDQGHQFLLSWTEYINKAPLVLKSLLQENFYEGICFYSIEQLNHIDHASDLLKLLSEKNYWIGFSREKKIFRGKNGLTDVLELWWLKKNSEGPRKDLTNLWAN